MTTIRIVLDTPLITADETRLLGQSCRNWIAPFCKAYGKPLMNIEVSTKPGPVGTWNFYLTDNKMIPGAFGHHGQENGYPAAWISPTACGVATSYAGYPKETWANTRKSTMFGNYSPIPGYQPFISAGLASVLAHEIMEAIIDPDPHSAISSPETNPKQWAKDADGNDWLIEVGDQANSGHFIVNVVMRMRKGLRIVTVQQLMVIADAALPSFYDLKGTTPFSFAALLLKLKLVVAAVPAAITKPFDHVKGCYAYIKGANGADMSMFARKEDVPEN